MSRTVADLVAGAGIGSPIAAVTRWPPSATRGSCCPPPRGSAARGACARRTPRCCFRREGEYWTVAFGGAVVRMRDAKGLGYLARSPARSPPRVPRARPARRRPAARNERRGRTASRRRCRTPERPGRARQARLSRADRRPGDGDRAGAPLERRRAGRAREDELDALTRGLAGALGLGGRDRRAASDSERARTSVTKALAQSGGAPGSRDPELGRHLSLAVHTGTFCSYEPDPRAPAPGTRDVTAVPPDSRPPGRRHEGRHGHAGAGTRRDPVDQRAGHATLDRLIERMDYRGTDPTFAAYRDDTRSSSTCRPWSGPGLGCGTGVMTRAIAARDVRRHADRDRPEPRVHRGRGTVGRRRRPRRPGPVRRGRGARARPWGRDFDVAVAQSLVSHVRDPLAVLAEAARMVRPGGSVAIFDSDYWSLTFDSPTRGWARRWSARSSR